MRGGVFALVDNISPDERNLAAAYNDFEKLRDPSHGRCLGLSEWTALLSSLGVTVEHSEHMDQDIRVRTMGPAHALRRLNGRAAQGHAGRRTSGELAQATRDRGGARLHPSGSDRRRAQAGLAAGRY
jgi:hypothetical protein